MRELVLLTSSDLPELHEDERSLPRILKTHGVSSRIEVWDKWNPQANEVGLIRSTWDYHRRYGEFLEFIGRIEEQKISIWNQVAVLRWNSHKSYLLSLAEKGVPIVPTQILYSERPLAIVSDRLVIKPAVSASAFQTRVVPANETANAFEILKINPAGILVQPFIEEIQKEGEWSLIFLNNKYSHAAIKVPKSGDFRVQEEHGAKVELAEAPHEIITAAEKILKVVNKKLLYARVDGVRVKGQFLLMELELIEPSLFFLESEAKLDDFAKSIKNVLA